MANRVRSHTRRTASGKTTRVQQHSRTGRPRKGLVSPGHAWGLLKRAHRASRRKKTVLACVLGGLAVGELVAWFTLDTAGLILCVAGGLCILGGTMAATASGRE